MEETQLLKSRGKEGEWVQVGPQRYGPCMRELVRAISLFIQIPESKKPDSYESGFSELEV